MKVVLDNNVPKRAVQALNNSGHEVVALATYEHDELWIKIAMDRGADIFVSQDSDVENFAINRGLSYIKLPYGVRGGLLVDFIVRRVNAIENVSKIYKEYPEIVVCRGLI